MNYIETSSSCLLYTEFQNQRLITLISFPLIDDAENIFTQPQKQFHMIISQFQATQLMPPASSLC